MGATDATYYASFFNLVNQLVQTPLTNGTTTFFGQFQRHSQYLALLLRCNFARPSTTRSVCQTLANLLFQIMFKMVLLLPAFNLRKTFLKRKPSVAPTLRLVPRVGCCLRNTTVRLTRQ